MDLFLIKANIHCTSFWNFVSGTFVSETLFLKLPHIHTYKVFGTFVLIAWLINFNNNMAEKRALVGACGAIVCVHH